MAMHACLSNAISIRFSSLDTLRSPGLINDVSARRRNASPICCSFKRKTGFVEQILDYIEGGPKLRKWYGAPDLRPKNEEFAEEEDESLEEETRDAILVTNGDSEIGQMVILSLIVKRARVKSLVKDKRAAVESFGTYVESISGDTRDKSFMKKALKGVHAIICPSNEGFFSEIGSMRGVQHIVLLSQLAVYRGSRGIQALMNDKVCKLAEKDEAAIIASGIPYTIIRAGLLQNSPGGQQGFSFKEGVAAEGKLSKEDAALICVEALDSAPRTGLIFEVANGEKVVLDWKECFASLMNEGGLLQ
ncbi:hypothetical protein H6P81_001829 [Aristolochia fimbriata]|uniref:NAD(P)-binding domain-containing protein n=1 Tax=Aristolochia fimbriata TaxID=158543 RepID=A0AAV7FBU8_ARIFI|nr:hypothetical protein H6P81_001829 [Aristolochia fimbriata]